MVVDRDAGKLEVRVGVISDTHGTIRRSALRAFVGVDLIVHAGDVGDAEVLRALERIAPVFAVMGNTDRSTCVGPLPETEVVEAGDALLYVLHDLGRLDLDPAAAGFHAVIFGHSHEPYAHRNKGVLYLNPGSAGPRRFRLPVSAAVLTVSGTALRNRFLKLP